MGSLASEESGRKKKAMWLYPKVLGFNPSERWGHSASYSHGVVYVFGGCCGGLHFGDVLALNLANMIWTNLQTTGPGPGPRDSHSALLVGRRMVVFGGTNGSRKVNDLHVLDLVSKEWTNPECSGTPPSSRESHTATLIGEDKMVIFGGSGEGEANYLNDLHVLDLTTMRWSSPQVKGNIPAPRDSHSAVAVDNKLFVYGGDRGYRYHGDVDVLDVESMTWTKLAAQGILPGVRAGHAAVNIGSKVYVIGGVGDKHYYNDVWMLDVCTCSWTKLDICGQQPQGRFSHTAVVTESDIAIYGGCGEDERPLNELLILQLGMEHPNGRYNISMCKTFGNHWSQGKRRFLRASQHTSKTMFLRNKEVLGKGVYNPECSSKQPVQFTSDCPQQKRRRNASAKASWEVESEQEEHSLSLSQHSSPSQSDQEQTMTGKPTESKVECSGFNLFKRSNNIPQTYDAASSQKEQIRIVQGTPYNLQPSREHKRPEQHVCIYSGGRAPERINKAGPIQSLMGAEVRGKVDGAFDSGLLMTATVNGRIFRGVLFPPAPDVVAPTRGTNVVAQIPLPPAATNPPSPIANVLPFRNPSHVERFASPQVATRPYSGVKTTAVSPNVRSDLHGVVLTLGGPRYENA